MSVSGLHSLFEHKKKELLKVLKMHKKIIGWTLADIPGISLAICMHEIHLKNEVKPDNHRGD